VEVAVAERVQAGVQRRLAWAVPVKRLLLELLLRHVEVALAPDAAQRAGGVAMAQGVVPVVVVEQERLRRPLFRRRRLWTSD
jgi:hypothetical protein